jgi:glycosyltransferase involved in cell wall biosynthesis
MGLLIVNTLPIPSGQASVNRILSLGKGLVENGENVTILSAAKSVDTNFHDINGIKYVNFAHSNNRLIGYIQSLFSILRFVGRNKKTIDAIWLVSNSPLLIWPLWHACKLNGIKYLLEKSEFPFVLMKKGVIAKLWAALYVNTIYKLFDGMIIMTQPLLEYFKGLVRKDCKLIKVPMTVDMTRFDNIHAVNEYGSYAAYCGNMSGNKDGVENLIEAFSYVEAKHPDFKLLLIGGANTEDEFLRIKKKVDSLKLHNIIFTGRISREEMPGYLMNAKILCLARPSSLQSAGGFPTKLGEYLTTGHPVVVTAVGEIPNYLNSSNSYLVSPDDNKKFGDTINEILDNYDKAKSIGLEGKQVALQNFNYAVQAVRLKTFLNELKKK